MYGSEAAKDFADYAEKASTKSLGRALLALGYGTAFAPEMDEGERVVDSPVRRPAQASTGRETQARVLRETPATELVGEEPRATEKQVTSIHKLCEALGKPEPVGDLSYAQARELLTQLSGEYQRARRAS